MLEAVGHYRIRQKIGQGAMGVVYAGWDDRLQRPVAVKTIDETKQGSVARSRLWREARSLARVNHPNICQVYDVLEEGEVLVLVMELLDGLSLADRLLAGLLDAAETLKTIRQMLQALQALHDLGIVHREGVLRSFGKRGPFLHEPKGKKTLGRLVQGGFRPSC